MEKWIAGLFGRKVVYLRDFDGEVTKKWAKQTPFGLTCLRMALVPFSRCLLLDGGKVIGCCYVHEWREAA
jgi:hypothetical protein